MTEEAGQSTIKEGPMTHERCVEFWEEHCKGVRSNVLSTIDCLLFQNGGIYVRGRLEVGQGI